ncbi:MAG: hypothetical protein ACP5DY_05790 [Thermovirgaceae bacterium]
MQGGEPKDTQDFHFVEEQGIRLWIDRGLSFQGDVVRLERYMSTGGPLVIAVNAQVR